MINQQRILATAMGGKVHVVRRLQIRCFRDGDPPLTSQDPKVKFPEDLMRPYSLSTILDLFQYVEIGESENAHSPA